MGLPTTLVNRASSSVHRDVGAGDLRDAGAEGKSVAAPSVVPAWGGGTSGDAQQSSVNQHSVELQRARARWVARSLSP